MKKVIPLLLISFLSYFCGQKQDFDTKEPTGDNKTSRIYALSNLADPSTIVMDNKRIYIEDSACIKLFDGRDFQFIKTIGSEGQGPGEFQDTATPQILPECLYVSSTNKISYFSLTGDFINETKHTLFIANIKAISDKYVGYVWVFREDYIAYILYDSEFKPIKELHRGKALIHPDGRRDFFEIFFYDVYEDKIVVASREGFTIDIFDSNGSVIHSIETETELTPFKEEDHQRVLSYWRDTGLNQEQRDILEKRTDFPDFYPSIQTCRLADGKIFVITYSRKGNKFECLIYDMNGKYIKRVYISLVMIAPNFASPFTISGNSVHQLIYDYEEERWELYINQF